MDPEYKIIGGDGAEYGPAALDEIRNWIRDGRVAGSTQVWRSDTSSWTSADHYSELRSDLTDLYASARKIIAQGLRPAGFWARLGAYAVDHFVLTIIFGLLWGPIARWHHWDLLPPVFPQVVNDATFHHFWEQSRAWLNNALPVYYPIFLLYDVWLNGTYGATLGKMAIGAKILMIDGSPIGYGTAFLRWLGARLSDFVFGFGYLLIAMREDKRALHDLLAGTRVVCKK